MPTSWQILQVLALLPATISAVTFDCSHIRVDKKSFNLKELGGPRSVHWQRSNPPSISNTTFTIDVCANLVKDDDIPSQDQCDSNTRVCGIERTYSDGKSMVTKVIDIAGEYIHGGTHLDPEWTRLKNSDGHNDAQLEGLRVVLHGGKYPHTSTGKKQKAIIEFLCAKNLTGNEGFEVDKRSVDSNNFGAMREREEGGEEGDGDGGDDGDGDVPALPDLDADKSLKFVRYDTDGEDEDVLRLSWQTKYACEGAIDDIPKNGGKSKGSWGFFTWFLIIVFLLAAAYIIFGSWLNYNRYGARGWDLIPHSDTIRDLPYMINDWVASVMDRFRGSGGSRGGYSAV
nr:autophagy-related protein 27 [Quercus suber]